MVTDNGQHYLIEIPENYFIVGGCGTINGRKFFENIDVEPTDKYFVPFNETFRLVEETNWVWKSQNYFLVIRQKKEFNHPYTNIFK